ncbi:hypothetical protein FHL15_003993 [Xylaria flabelliformis]|uniref:Cytochrome P450 n=1 Tax=Xylaria flabelliformis TaxID=2512241 RepID=A0A553I519_9PEZI|nr:hypothetical protein FHL15_003993 [Xylaria flabelliformis]
MGDIWVLVTPLKNWIYVNDPDALMSIFKRPTDFPRPVWAEGESWRRQRKIAIRCFNEQTNAILWAETIALAGDVLHRWTKIPSLVSAADDMRTLTLNAFSRAALGKSFESQGSNTESLATPSAKESLRTILNNLVFILAFGTEFISYPWLPQRFRIVHKAWVTFRSHLINTYEAEKRDFAEDKLPDHNLMTLLIRASQDEVHKSGASGGLTESEIYGNMFAFSSAGHDTTANTFTFAIYFLSAHPQYQDWLFEEIQAVLGDREIWDYRTDFPRLKRCLAVMFETMRLYAPIPVIKWTADKTQPLSVGNKTFLLPPQCIIAPSYGAVHTDPRFWGSDSLVWRPSRWIKAGNAGNEEFNAILRGSFIGWSEGIRDCPGRKFSQVEFSAAIAVLFRGAYVDPVARDGETMDAARARVLDLIKNDSGTVLLLQMLHPERAPLRWSRREKSSEISAKSE